MPWCPRCKTEYRQGFTHCADCGAALTPNRPPNFLEPVEVPDQLLISVTRQAECDLVLNRLREVGIPACSRDRGVGGGAAKLYTGFSPYGTDIYVPANYLEEAQALFEPTDLDLDEEALNAISYDADSLNEAEEEPSSLHLAALFVIAAIVIGFVLTAIKVLF